MTLFLAVIAVQLLLGSHAVESIVSETIRITIKIIQVDESHTRFVKSV